MRKRMTALRHYFLLLLLTPLVALAWQARVWPEIKDVSPLVTFTKEMTQARDRYKLQNQKFDFAFLPEKEWPKVIADMKPQAVLIERGYILIALVFDAESMQAIAVISEDSLFQKDKQSWIIEDTSDPRIKHVFSKKK
jgi:hypothetical protein